MPVIQFDAAFWTRVPVSNTCMRKGAVAALLTLAGFTSNRTSKLNAPYVTAMHGLAGLAKIVAKERGRQGVRANMICPGYVRTPLANTHIHEQANE
ncbi:MAG: SDR family oxidoreductase [Comamonas sp.]